MQRVIKIAGALALMGGLTGGAQMVAAHHAMMYDSSKTLTLEGTLVEFRWTNPHVFVRVDDRTEEGAQPALWMLETSSPINLTRLGNWSETALKPGDRVKVEINPHRETERHEARLYRLTLVDTGQVFGTAYRGMP
jgi:hypothetical protein